VVRYFTNKLTMTPVGTPAINDSATVTAADTAKVAAK
jgi:hypothetical protein